MVILERIGRARLRECDGGLRKERVPGRGVRGCVGLAHQRIGELREGAGVRRIALARLAIQRNRGRTV